MKMIDLPNQRTCKLTLTRGEVCKILLSMTAQYEADPEARRQIRAIHDKIREQLGAHDKKWEGRE